MSVYRRGHKWCWKCGARTVVFTWQGHEEWQKTSPPEPIPDTVRWLYSNTIGEYYWANACEHCGTIQGDWYLFYDQVEDPIEWEPWGDEARAAIDAAWERYGSALGYTFVEMTDEVIQAMADGGFSEDELRAFAAEGARVVWEDGKYGAIVGESYARLGLESDGEDG